MTRAWYFLCAITVAAQAVGAPLAGLTFRPVEVSHGELLFLVHPETAEGVPNGGSGDRFEVLYLHDPSAGWDRPKVLWHGEGNVAPRPLARMSRDVVLMDFEDRAFFLTLSTGAVAPLLRTDDETKVLLVDESKVYFLHRTIPDTSPGAFHWEKRRWLYDRPADFLMMTAANQSDRPVRLAPEKIERVLAITENTFWVVTAGRRRHLARITERGSELIAPWNKHWIAPLATIYLSPDQLRLAVEMCHDLHDFSVREVVVVHLPSRRVCFSRSNVGVAIFGSAHQVLPMRWKGPTHLCIYETSFRHPEEEANWVVMDAFGRLIEFDDEQGREISDGKGVSFYADAPPDPPSRERIGAFDREFGRLYFAGEQEPVISLVRDDGVEVDDVTVSPSGNWAVASGTTHAGTTLINGRRRSTSGLLRGGSYDHMWLPSVSQIAQTRVLPDAWERNEK